MRCITQFLASLHDRIAAQRNVAPAPQAWQPHRRGTLLTLLMIPGPFEHDEYRPAKRRYVLISMHDMVGLHSRLSVHASPSSQNDHDGVLPVV